MKLTTIKSTAEYTTFDLFQPYQIGNQTIIKGGGDGIIIEDLIGT